MSKGTSNERREQVKDISVRWLTSKLNRDYFPLSQWHRKQEEQ